MIEKYEQLEKADQASSQMIVFDTYDMPGPPPEPITLTPEDDEWASVLSKLEELGVKEWKAKYSDPSVLDGNGWSLVVRSTELNRKSSGMNAYPPNFDAVREVIERAARQGQL